MLFFRKHDSDIDIPFEMKNWINRQSKRRNKVFCEFSKKIIVTLQAGPAALFICRVYPDAAISNLKYPETGAGDSGGGC